MALAEGDSGPRVVWANGSICELLGLALGELVGQTLSDLAGLACDPEDAGCWGRMVAELIRGWGGQREGGVRRLDDVDVRVQIEAQHLPSPRPEEPEGWLITLHPLTDAAADQAAALREAEHRFRALAEAAPIGIFVSEAGLRLGYVNDRFIELTQLSRYQLLGTEWMNAVDSEDLPNLFTAAEAVLAGTPRELSIRMIGAEDTPRWLYLRLAPTTTPARAAGFVGTAEDITDRRAWEEKITYQAHHDPLTGLVNRRRMVELLQEILVSRRTLDRHFALMFLDLDGFKTVNDTHGHDAGDRVLVEVARRLRRVAREYDIVARVSGDEFVVILRNVVNRADVESAARRQLAAMEDPIPIGDADLAHISVSIGAVAPTGTDTPESLLRLADQMMYQAKARGGSGFRLAVRTEDDGGSDEKGGAA